MIERPRLNQNHTFSELLGNITISRDTTGIRIGTRRFAKAIALVGDATGLEALQAAKNHPDTAIFILDPHASGFAGKLYPQLVQKPEQRFDWSFFTGDPNLPGYYSILSHALRNNSDDIARIEKEYNRHRKTAKDARSSIFLADATTHSISPEPGLFDEVRITYPEPNDLPVNEFPGLFRFLNQSLREGGRCIVATDIMTYYEELLKFAYRNITRHGWTSRTGKVSEPLSVYDILNGKNGYFYVKMTKTKPFPEMGAAKFMSLDIMYSMMLLGLYRMTFGKHKEDRKE